MTCANPVQLKKKLVVIKFNIINDNLNLLGWVVLKSDIVVVDKYHLAWSKLNILNQEIY